MDSTADLQTIRVGEEVSAIPDIGVGRARWRNRAAGRTASDADSAGPGPAHEGKVWRKGRLGNRIDIVGGAGEAGAERIEDSRRHRVRFVQAQHLHLESEARCEQSVRGRRQTVAIVQCVDRRKRVPFPERVVGPDSAEILLDGLFGMVE